jgi:hypothetical protein
VLFELLEIEEDVMGAISNPIGLQAPQPAAQSSLRPSARPPCRP